MYVQVLGSRCYEGLMRPQGVKVQLLDPTDVERHAPLADLLIIDIPALSGDWDDLDLTQARVSNLWASLPPHHPVVVISHNNSEDLDLAALVSRLVFLDGGFPEEEEAHPGRNCQLATPFLNDESNFKVMNEDSLGLFLEACGELAEPTRTGWRFYSETMLRQVDTEPYTQQDILEAEAAAAQLEKPAGTWMGLEDQPYCSAIAMTVNGWPAALLFASPTRTVYLLPGTISVQSVLIGVSCNNAFNVSPQSVASEDHEWADARIRYLLGGRENPWVGDGPTMRALWPDLLNAYEYPKNNILLLGEPGTGKEEWVRLLSRLRNCKFERMDLAGAPATLVESTVYGYKKGAFTGAFSDTEGLIARVGDGLLYIDGLEACTLEVQALFIRVLGSNTREYYSVGGKVPETVKCQFVFSCNKSIQELLYSGQLRMDLIERFEMKVRLPALRERRADIPALVRHFVDSSGIECHGLNVEALIRECQLADWSGPRANVRGLRNRVISTMQRLALRPQDKASRIRQKLTTNLPKQGHYTARRGGGTPKTKTKIHGSFELIDALCQAETISDVLDRFGYAHVAGFRGALRSQEHAKARKEDYKAFFTEVRQRVNELNRPNRKR